MLTILIVQQKHTSRESNERFCEHNMKSQDSQEISSRATLFQGNIRSFLISVSSVRADWPGLRAAQAETA